MKRFLASLLALALVAAFAFAHETQTVSAGDETYDVIVGYATEPAYTEERNGLDLIVRDGDGQPVDGLERSLNAVLVAPDGEATRELTLRAVWGTPGSYTADFVLSEAGVYSLLLDGFIGTVEVDLSYEMHDVAPFEELRFP